MEPVIIVKYGSAGYFSAKKEVHNVLAKLGNQKADEELLIPGFITIKTKLDPHEVIEDARELFLGNPDSFSATTEWIPVTAWCTPGEIAKTINEEVADLIMPDEEYALEILKYQSTISDDDIINKVVPLIKARPGYNPYKIIRIQIADNKVAISLLKPNDVLHIWER